MVIRREAGVAELLADGVDGLVVVSDEEMALAIQRLISDTTLRARIAAHNESVLPPASWSSVMEQHESLYGSLSSSH